MFNSMKTLENKLFELFLKKNRVLTKYKKYYDADFSTVTPTNIDYEFINSCFNWDKTEEGFRFWENIARERSIFEDEHKLIKSTKISRLVYKNNIVCKNKDHLVVRL